MESLLNLLVYCWHWRDDSNCCWKCKRYWRKESGIHLSATYKIEGSKSIVIGSVDSDGDDGPGIQFSKEKGFQTLAGGIVDGYTANEAKEKRIDIFKEIDNHNTTPALLSLESGILAEHNISLVDLTVILIQGT